MTTPRRLLTIIASLASLTAAAHANAESCATLKNLQGHSCGTFKYDVDASACADKTVVGKPVVHCSIDTVTVKFETAAKAFTAMAVLEKGADGKKMWDLSGVREADTKAPAAAVATAPAAPEAKAEPKRETAQAAPAAPAAAPAPAAAAPAALEVNGYLDAYYQYNPNKQHFTDARIFAARNNTIELNDAEVTVKRKQGDVAFRIDFAAGEMVDNLSGKTTTTSGTTGWGTNATTSAAASTATANEPTRFVPQAILTYTPSTVPGLTVTAGKMYTNVGYEVTRAKDNWLYSRGILYTYAIPLWHEGASVGYAFIPDKFSGTIYAYNGWDGRTSQENNNSQTFAANLNVTAVKDLVVNYNYIGGPEGTDAGQLRQVHELNAQYTINSRFAVAADYVMGSQQKAIGGTDDAKWTSWGLYGKAGIISWLSAVARYEAFDDSDQGFAVSGALGAAGTKQKLASYTVGLNADLGDGLESRLEYRHDSSDTTSTLFLNDSGAATNNESTATLAVLYSF